MVVLATRSDPSAATLREEAERQFDTNRFEEALATYTKLLAAHPDDIDGWRGKGHTLSRLGRAKEALAAYDEAVKLAPQNAAVWNDRAVQLMVLGRGKEALESLDRASALDPKSPLYFINRSAVLATLFEDIPGALRAVDTAIALAPNHPLGYLAKIQLLRGMGDEDGAKACLEAGLAACPDSRELQAEQMFY